MTSHIVVAVYLCAAACQPEQLRIWDGDSFLIGMRSGSERIRIENIDTPEINGKCIREIDLADQAKSRLAELMNGNRIEIVRNGRGKYKRTLARVLVNGIDVGDILISEGLARPWSGRRQTWC